jgi:hypothetical protein
MVTVPMSVRLFGIQPVTRYTSNKRCTGVHIVFRDANAMSIILCLFAAVTRA